MALNLQDTEGQDDGQGDSDMAAKLQGSSQGGAAYRQKLNSHRKDPKLRHANIRTCHEAKLQMSTAKNVCIQDRPATHELDDQHICMVAQNTGRSKNKNIFVDIVDYKSLTKELADQIRTNIVLQLSSNFWKAECEWLRKELLEESINFECSRLLAVRQALPSTSASQTSNCLIVFGNYIKRVGPRVWSNIFFGGSGS